MVKEYLREIAHESIGKRVDLSYAFIFKDPETQEVLGVARNLTDLLIHLEKVDIRSLRYHVYRTATQALDGSPNVEHPRSDIALWIQYVLGDDELATKIWNLREIVDDQELREAVLKVIQERHDELKAVLTES